MNTDDISDVDLPERPETESDGAVSSSELVRCGECGIESESCGVVNDGKPICWQCYMKIMDNILSKLSPAKETAPNDRGERPERITHGAHEKGKL